MTLPQNGSVDQDAAQRHNVLNVHVSIAPDGDPVCTPELLDVSGRDVMIAFTLDAHDWVFPSHRAVVVTDGGTQFPFPSWTVNRKLALLFDRNTSQGSFQYTVSVRHVPTGEIRSVDPTIRNET